MSTPLQFTQSAIAVVVLGIIAMSFSPDIKTIIIPPLVILLLVNILLSLFNWGRGLIVSITILILVLLGMIPVVGYLFMVFALLCGIVLVFRSAPRQKSRPKVIKLYN